MNGPWCPRRRRSSCTRCARACAAPFPVRAGAWPRAAPSSRGRRAPRASRGLRERRALRPGGRAAPHGALRIPAQRAVPDVVGRTDPAHPRRSVARHAARVAAVEDRQELQLVGQLAVQVIELVVGDRVLDRPVEVVGDQRLVAAVDDVAQDVARHLGPVAAVVEHARVALAHAFEQPLEPLEHAGRRRAVVEHDADVLGREARLLQQLAHQVRVVDAPRQAHLRIGVLVDADQKSPVLAPPGPCDGRLAPRLPEERGPAALRPRGSATAPRRPRGGSGSASPCGRRRRARRSASRSGRSWTPSSGSAR